MPDYTLSINLADYKRGDKWIGKTFPEPKVSLDGVSTPAVPSGTLSRVRAYFVKDAETFRLDSDPNQTRDAAITISDVNTWEVVVPELSAFLPTAGVWEWDMEFYAVGDTAPLTLFKGTITVHPDITTGATATARTTEDGTARTTEDGTARTSE